MSSVAARAYTLGASPRTFFTTDSTSSARKGLTMKSAAPASMASITSDSWPSAEQMTTTALGSPLTISRVASMPLLYGITMSMVVRSGLSERYFSMASMPWVASPTTSYPPELKMSRIMFRMNTASSTISTRFGMDGGDGRGRMLAAVEEVCHRDVQRIGVQHRDRRTLDPGH